jgi:hypothetical protein
MVNLKRRPQKKSCLFQQKILKQQGDGKKFAKYRNKENLVNAIF